MIPVVITEPAKEPVSLNEAKTHLRVTGNDEDAHIANLIKAARIHCEREICSRAFITQTLEATYDRWPAVGIFRLPHPPLQAVTSIKYTDEDGDETTWDAANYLVDTVYERVVKKSGVSWPTATLQEVAGIKVRYTAGYGDSAGDVPQPIRQAILLLVADWYENREESIVGTISTPIQIGIERLLAGYSSWTKIRS